MGCNNCYDFKMEIIQGIHLVDGTMGNVYLVIEDGEMMLIDTGMPGNAKKILGYVESELKRKPTDIKTIVLTHHHVDHAGSLFDLKKATNAQVAIHSLDADYISGKKKQVIKVKSMKSLIIWIFGVLFKAKNVEPDILLNDNDPIKGYVVIHTPGHTEGSISLYGPANKVIFVGDAIRNDKGVLGESSAYSNQDSKEARRSIEKISKLDFEVMISGHGEPLKPAAAGKVREFYKNLH